MKKERKIVYGVIIAVISVLLILTCYLLFYFYSMRDISITKEYVRVSDDDSINYTIKLKDNGYISDSSKVTSYMTDMIDYVNVFYNYKSKFSDKVEGKVTINVNGVLVGTSKEDNSTMLYNEFFKPEVAVYDVNGSIINISDTYKLDFSSQYKTFETFKSANDVDLDGYIKYEVSVNYTVYSDLIRDSINKTVKLYATMPLGGSTKIELSDPVTTSEVKYAKMREEQKPLFLVICLELFGAACLFVILLIMILNNMKDSVSIYERELEKALNKYNRRIVKLRSVPDLSDKNVVMVKSFEDLDNVSKVKNINFIEIIENKLAIFFINDNGTTYVYNFDSKRVK